MKDSQFKLALVRYVYDELGYSTTDSSEPFEEIAETFQGNDSKSPPEQTRWYTAGKRAFTAPVGELSEEKHRELDSNINSYLERLNSSRDSPIQLRYYQYLAVFFTEFLLEQRGEFIENFNSFVDEEFWQFDEEVLHLQEFSKLAYWMATGSGKTHIMHINMLQTLSHFDEREFDNFILVAPTEQVAEQHREELSEFGIGNCNIRENSVDGRIIQVTDINKLKRGETGPKTVDVEEFGTENVIFVDEGHKGLGSLGGSGSGWIEKREYLTQNGFAFEYSATFASSLNNASGYQEYSRSIVFDYPYGRFHKDRYGKDFNILNIEPGDNGSEFIEDEQKKWLLANLLAYYEKVRIFEEEESIADQHNIEKPLSVFVGNSVNALTRGESDVQTIITFLSEVIQNTDNWVITELSKLLQREGQFSETGIFNDRFDYLQNNASTPTSMYDDLLQRLFSSTESSSLVLERLKNLEDEEIGISTDTSESYVGVITVGDTKEFFDRMNEEQNAIQTVENEMFSSSLFSQIDSKNSPINFLIGSKKFAEGWDSTRPSTLGLMNLGRSEGPLVVQMFGRGVRVNGQDENGKRGDLKKVSQSNKFQISRLETLDVFGIRADYIETFKQHLESERVSVDENIQRIEVSVKNNAKSTGLKVPEFTKKKETPICSLSDVMNEKDMSHLLQVGGSESERSVEKPSLHIQMQGTRITSDSENSYSSETYVHSLQDMKIKRGEIEYELTIDALDWDSIWASLVQYKNEQDYTELCIERDAVKQLFKNEYYELRGPKELLTVRSSDDVSRIEGLCTHLLSEYIDSVYKEMKESILDKEISLREISVDWLRKHNPSKYSVEVHEPEENEGVVKELQSTNFEGDIFRYVKQAYAPVLLDSDALQDYSSYQEQIKSISPEGINNVGERKFIDSLQWHIENGVLQDYETMIMRNQSGVGISIPEVTGKMYPDFVIWATKDGVQHIILSDPHGLILGGTKSEIDAIQKVNAMPTEDENVSVHASFFARSKNYNSLEEAKHNVAEFNNLSRSELEEKNIYFVDETVDGIGDTTKEIEKMFQSFLTDK